jgi:hypothetical protein
VSFYCAPHYYWENPIENCHNNGMICDDQGLGSHNMFDDKPDNQPVHYTKSGLSNDVCLDPLWLLVVSKFQTEKNLGAQQAQQEMHH